ncbi:ABC transporter permease [Lonsdalea quercina]|uniref:ABC transporter permease n=1 Tax=Lonsdalea quercina TaxID=71657 RepID=UPI0039770BFA
MFEDIIDAIKKPQIWLYLSWYDIKQRYKRSTLGPLWVTISTGVLVGMLSLLWSTLFKMDVKDYLPFFCIGQVVWTFFSMQLTESCNAFVQFDYIIRQTKVSFNSLVMRVLSRNFIVFFHNLIIIFVVITFVGPGWSWTALWAIPSFLLLSFALFSLSMILAIACTRFRDLQMIVQNILLVCFYFTPIMWKKEQLSEQWLYIINVNPLVHFFDIIRKPILGMTPDAESVKVSILISLGLFVIAQFLVLKTRRRIAYWL